MSRRSNQHRATLSLAIVWLSGCSVLAPQRDVARFYTLNPVEDSGAHDDRPSHGLIYGLGPIELPRYLDRTELASRFRAAEVTYSRTDLWAEPLKTNLTNVLLQDLSVLLGSDRIVLYPWARSVPVNYQIAVTVLRFERTAPAEVQLHARWSIRDPHSGADFTTKESNFVRAAAAPTTADAVNALSIGVGDLSRDIAAALQSLPVPQRANPHQIGASKAADNNGAEQAVRAGTVERARGHALVEAVLPLRRRHLA